MQDAVKSVLPALLEGRIRVYVNDIKFFRETRRPHSGRTGTDITFRRSSKIKNWKLEATGFSASSLVGMRFSLVAKREKGRFHEEYARNHLSLCGDDKKSYLLIFQSRGQTLGGVASCAVSAYTQLRTPHRTLSAHVNFSRTCV